MFEIGTSLREARQRQALDFPELEQATKIRGKYLRALEDEQFDVLPAQTYVKGFLRSYADQLGLDGQLYVDEYNSRYVPGEEETPVRVRRSTVQHRRLESNVVLLTLGGIALVTALVFVAWKFGGSNAQKTPLTGLPKPSAVRTPPPSTAALKPKAPPFARLILTATGSGSWVQVRLGGQAGRMLYEGMVAPGQPKRFVKRRLWIVMSLPTNLDLTLNGRKRFLPDRGPATVIATAKGIRSAS